eukprot:GSMAST32.ASY1.ANO1.738.1 assembled CDS
MLSRLETMNKKSALEILREKMKKKELKKVDHATANYEDFRKKFYIEAHSLTKFTGEENESRLDTWEQCGLSSKIMYVLEKSGYKEPFPIQRQAIPALMSGRDMLGVAKTGSGKTLAFLLPIFRPIALILAPARELFLNLTACAVYGGSSVGVHIVTCTPGRFIDILTMNAGRLISLRRVTFLNIRPDRQTALFSATFPAHVSRKLLKHKPVEIVVGGRSNVSNTITQFVEIRSERQKWLRLLQLLDQCILIFVETQKKSGYFVLSLHGGKEQVDREQSLLDFKQKTRKILIATSVAGRGLDVKDLNYVVNFDTPNHLEDYVHRVGRTGRAGKVGTSYTCTFYMNF